MLDSNGDVNFAQMCITGGVYVAITMVLALTIYLFRNVPRQFAIEVAGWSLIVVGVGGVGVGTGQIFDGTREEVQGVKLETSDFRRDEWMASLKKAYPELKTERTSPCVPRYVTFPLMFAGIVIGILGATMVYRAWYPEEPRT